MIRFKVGEGSRMDEKSTQKTNGITNKNATRKFVSEKQKVIQQLGASVIMAIGLMNSNHWRQLCMGQLLEILFDYNPQGW